MAKRGAALAADPCVLRTEQEAHEVLDACSARSRAIRLHWALLRELRISLCRRRRARAAGAFDRRWLPEIVPPDAVDIWEFHNIDSGFTWVCFGTPGGAQGIREILKKRGARQVTGPVDHGPRGLLRVRDWWPASMGEANIEAYALNEGSRSVLLVGVDVTGEKSCVHRGRRNS